MKILLVNDDGIYAEGIRHLILWAKQWAEVMVCAPKTQQSGTSQAVHFISPIEAKPAVLDYAPDVPAWWVDSTPADCVRIAYYYLNWRPDLVLSGINKGLNMGEDIGYSGTDGAIFEASYAGIKAVALSTHPEGFNDAVGALDALKDYFIKRDLLSQCGLWNINIPENPRDILITRQGGPYYRDSFEHIGNNMYEAHGYSALINEHNLELDTNAVMCGYTSVTPLTTVHTNWEVYNKLK